MNSVLSVHLRVSLVLFAIIMAILIFRLISKNKLPIKYSLFWLVALLLIFLVGFFPNFIGFFTSFVGFQTTSNLVVGIILGILLTITLLMTIIVAEQKRKSIILIQELSFLKAKVKELDTKKDK